MSRFLTSFTGTALYLDTMAPYCFDLVSHDSDFDRVPMVRRYTL